MKPFTRLFPVIALAAAMVSAAGTLLVGCAGGSASAVVSSAVVSEAAGSETAGSEATRPAPSTSLQADSRLLMADGKLYRGTSETGPMGDSDSVDGHIRSSVKPDETPGAEGESNFGCIENPYTMDFGDGFIMVLLEDNEWHIFRAAEPSEVSGSLCAFITRIDQDKLYVDTAEWVTPEDTDRVRELGLSERDMPDGYYIYNPSRSRTVLTLTDHTTYRFIDWGGDIVSPTDLSERQVETTDKSKFLQYLDTYENSTPGMPFFIEVEDGSVRLIEEKPIA